MPDPTITATALTAGGSVAVALAAIKAWNMTVVRLAAPKNGQAGDGKVLPVCDERHDNVKLALSGLSQQATSHSKDIRGVAEKLELVAQDVAALRALDGRPANRGIREPER